MTALPSPDRHRARRSDAQRNHERILDTARIVVAEQGTSASLRDIARRAGVGMGTLYRHFPTRDALLEALLNQGFQNLVDRAKVLRQDRSPQEAFAEWLAELADSASAYHGLAASIMGTLQDPTSALWTSCAAVHDTLAQLLNDAQLTGHVRTDVTASDVFALIGALASLGEYGHALSERRGHLIGVLLDGLRTSTHRK